MSTLGRLTDAEQFADIILKTDADGRIVRLRRRRPRSSSGAQGYDQTCTLDGKPSVALSIYQLPGSNALDDRRRGRDEDGGAEASASPQGVDYAIVYDTTPFIPESISEVFKTLRDAVILVAVVVLLFLQNWRSALIPLVAVPVAIVGTFAVMAAIGLQPQQPDAVRPGAGDRHRGRRRDRRRRGGRAPHRARPGAARGDDPGDGAGVRAGDRRSAWCWRRCSCPCAFITRHHRPVLPPVRPDDRRLDAHLGVQLADAQPGALRPCCSRPRTSKRDLADAAAQLAASAGSSSCSTGVRQGRQRIRLVGRLARCGWR